MTKLTDDELEELLKGPAIEIEPSDLMINWNDGTEAEVLLTKKQMEKIMVKGKPLELKF